MLKKKKKERKKENNLSGGFNSFIIYTNKNNNYKTWHGKKFDVAVYNEDRITSWNMMEDRNTPPFNVFQHVFIGHTWTETKAELCFYSLQPLKYIY